MEWVQSAEGEELGSVLRLLTYERVVDFSSPCHQMEMIFRENPYGLSWASSIDFGEPPAITRQKVRVMRDWKK